MANAWASYVTNIKERAPGDFGNGAIIGKDGSKWVDQGLGITDAEAQRIGRCFQKRNFDSMKTEGFRINSQKYTFIDYNKEQDLVVGKAKGGVGMSLQGTKRAVLIGSTPAGKQIGNVNKAVGDIANHLKKSGY